MGIFSSVRNYWRPRASNQSDRPSLACWTHLHPPVFVPAPVLSHAGQAQMRGMYPFAVKAWCSKWVLEVGRLGAVERHGGLFVALLPNLLVQFGIAFFCRLWQRLTALRPRYVSEAEEALKPR